MLFKNELDKGNISTQDVVKELETLSACKKMSATVAIFKRAT